MVQLNTKKNCRISHDYITIQKYVGDKANLTVLRKGERINVTLTVEKVPRLVPKHHYDKKSKDLSYFIFGGFVFLPLSIPYLKSYYGNDWSKTCPINLCHVALTSSKQYKDEEVVILTCVLADQLNIGYHGFSQAIVTKCNGVEIHNVAQLAKICDEYEGEYIKFEIQRDYDKRISVLDTKVARQQVSQILNEHQITHDRSFLLRQYQRCGYPMFDFQKSNENTEVVGVSNNSNDDNLTVKDENNDTAKKTEIKDNNDNSNNENHTSNNDSTPNENQNNGHNETNNANVNNDNNDYHDYYY